MNSPSEFQAIDLRAETLMRISDVAEKFGVHRSTVEGWVDCGLESVLMRRLVYTSVEGLERFSRPRNRQQADSQSNVIGSERERDEGRRTASSGLSAPLRGTFSCTAAYNAAMVSPLRRRRISRMLSIMERTDVMRVDALSQLKRAQLMIAEGRKELVAANEKIEIAQRMIDESAEILRGSLPHVLHVHPANPR